MRSNFQTDQISTDKQQNWFARLEGYATANTYLILTLMASLAFLAGTFILRSKPPALSTGETMTWWSIATNLIHGYGYSLCNQYYFPFCDVTSPLTAMREPAPVLLFAGVSMLFKESLLAAGVVELLLLIGIMITLFFLTKEWTGSALAGLAAAFLWGIYPRAYSLISQVSGDLLAGLGVSTGILFVLRARKSDLFNDWLIAGIGLGIAVMSRSAMLMIALTVIIGLIIERWDLRRRLMDWLRPSLILAAIIASILTPWLIRTDLVFGRPLIGSSLVGYNIFRHNYMLGTDNYLRYVGNEEGFKAIQALIVRRTDLRGNENEAQMDLIYRQEGLKIIASHPVRYGLLSSYRFCMLWFDWRISEAFGYSMGFNEYAMLVVQVILLTFALAGLKKNIRRTWPLWASLIMVTLAYMAVDSRMLYTSPIMPLVMSLSAVGLIQLISKRSAFPI